MKKILLIVLITITSILLVSCSGKEIKKGETDSLVVNVDKDDVKIMQLTDVHLTYGFDYLDRKTFNLIDELIKIEKPDIIIVTGDLYMTIFAKSVFKKFIKFIDKYDIPWSITFGNHEMEFHKMTTIVNVLLSVKTNNLYFSNNPILGSNDANGYSNFRLEIKNGSKHLLNIYLLDSKANRTDGIKDSRFPYDYISYEQVAWYSSLVKEDTVKSLTYIHMPLMQYLSYEGIDRHEPSWPQGMDTGIYAAMIDPSIGKNKALGVFTGHDHLNSFAFKLDEEGPLLAYGLSSGYNAYGNHKKGARFVTFNYNEGTIDSYLVNEEDLGL